MIGLDDYLTIKVQQFLLVFFRVGGIFMSGPIFGQNQVPFQIKAAFAFVISLAILPVVKIGSVSLWDNWAFFSLQIGRELIVGVIIGFGAMILFNGIQYGGDLVSRQMGLGMAELYDPLTGEESSPIEQLLGVTAAMLFFTFNGHHWLIIAVTRSFDMSPAGNAVMGMGTADRLVRMVGDVFVIGIKIAAPAFVLLLVTTIIVGVVAKAVPQMNVLIVGMPLKISLGIIGLIISVPTFGFLFSKFFTSMQKDVMYLLKEM